MTDYLDTLRDYQREAVLAIEAATCRKPCAQLATAAGKSRIAAALALRARDRGERVLVLAHRDELIKQNAAAIRALDPDARIGIAAAAQGRREYRQPITVGMITTVAAHLKKLDAANRPLPQWGLAVADEAHRVPHLGEGQYRTLLAHYPDARVIGLTATPSRLGGGPIYATAPWRDLPPVANAPFDECVYRKTIGELTADGYLSPLTAVSARRAMDMQGVTISSTGDYVVSAMSASAMRVLPETVADILDRGQDRKAWLVFAADVAHGRALHARLAEHVPCALITGETPAGERAKTLRNFAEGKLRCITNCAVMTTGTDVPRIDMVVLARATTSPELFVQMVGRGARLSPETGKVDCLILDAGGNVQRHGGVSHAESPERMGDGGGAPPMKICGTRVMCRNCRCKLDGHNLALPCPGCGADVSNPYVVADGCGHFAFVAERMCKNCCEVYPVPPRKIVRGTGEVVELTSRKGAKPLVLGLRAPKHPAGLGLRLLANRK